MTDTALPRTAQDAPPARPGRRRPSLTWLGLVPFLLFSTLFLLIPTFYLVVGSLRDSEGQFTLQNYQDLTNAVPLNAYVTSIEVSFVTALARRDLRVPDGLRRDLRRAASVPRAAS